VLNEGTRVTVIAKLICLRVLQQMGDHEQTSCSAVWTVSTSQAI